MKLESILYEIIRFLGGVLSLLAVGYALLSIFYLVYGLYLLVYDSPKAAYAFFRIFISFSFPILVLSSLLSYGLWNHKRWARYFVIVLVLVLAADMFWVQIREYGSLALFPLKAIMLVLVLPSMIMLFFFLPPVRKIMSN